LEELHCQCQIALCLEHLSHKDYEETNAHINRTSYLLSKLRTSFA
jgi:hypothetical protein